MHNYEKITNLTITKEEAEILQDMGWSSGFGWENALDWWRENNYESCAYDNYEVYKQLVTDLNKTKNRILRNRYKEMTEPFNEAMVDKLVKNDYKGQWDSLNPIQAFKRIIDETAELMESIINEQDPDEVLKEAADVANFAFITFSTYWHEYYLGETKCLKENLEI